MKILYENVYKNGKKCFYYENIKFFIIFKKLSQHMILVNISQQKVNTRSTHGQYHPTYQNVQNFIKKMNLVNIWFFGQQKVNITQHIKIFVYILPLTYGGWAGKLKYQVFFKRFYQNKNYIFGQQKVNITQHTKSFVYVLLLKHGGWVGELKYQVFPKDFIKI